MSISAHECWSKSKNWGATGSASVVEGLRIQCRHWQSQWHTTPNLSLDKQLACYKSRLLLAPPVPHDCFARLISHEQHWHPDQ
jgi:hypothetical protein